VSEPATPSTEEEAPEFTFTLRTNGARQEAVARIDVMHMCYAAKVGDVSELSRLLEGRADVNGGDYDQRTPLHIAVSRAEVDVVQLLLQHRADAQAFDHYGQTPLYEAERAGHFAIEKLLKKNGAHLQQRRMMRHSSQREKWSLRRSEIHLKEKLSETLKSDIFFAEWRGSKVVAKQTKLVTPADDFDLQLELLHEIKILSTVRHPDLVLFLGACLDDGPLTIISEFMPDGDLETHFSRKRKELQDIYIPKLSLIKQWACSIAQALCFLHNCNPPIVHRDLKPLNLLLTDQCRRLKVTDFGISALQPSAHGSQEELHSYTMTGGVGTWLYMAPEVVRCQQYDEKVDIYSFSLILYFMASGRQPFHELGADSEIVLKKYLSGEEPRPNANEAVAPLRSIMSEAWDVDPLNRPSAYDLATLLSGVLSGASRCVGCTVS
jgi:serine/threonine protein kinase